MNEETNPLWMPQGSVRAVLTIGTWLITAYLVATGADVPEWWQLTNAGMTGSYFASRILANRSQHQPEERMFSEREDTVELQVDESRAWRNI
jgi:hypothetical protein